MTFKFKTYANKTEVLRHDGEVAAVFYDAEHERSARAWVSNL